MDCRYTLLRRTGWVVGGYQLVIWKKPFKEFMHAREADLSLFIEPLLHDVMDIHRGSSDVLVMCAQNKDRDLFCCERLSASMARSLRLELYLYTAVDSPLVQGASRLRYTDKAQMQRPGHTGRKALATKKSNSCTKPYSHHLPTRHSWNDGYDAAATGPYWPKGARNKKKGMMGMMQILAGRAQPIHQIYHGATT